MTGTAAKNAGLSKAGRRNRSEVRGRLAGSCKKSRAWLTSRNQPGPTWAFELYEPYELAGGSHAGGRKAEVDDGLFTTANVDLLSLDDGATIAEDLGPQRVLELLTNRQDRGVESAALGGRGRDIAVDAQTSVGRQVDQDRSRTFGARGSGLLDLLGSRRNGGAVAAAVAAGAGDNAVATNVAVATVAAMAAVATVALTATMTTMATMATMATVATMTTVATTVAAAAARAGAATTAPLRQFGATTHSQHQHNTVHLVHLLHSKGSQPMQYQETSGPGAKIVSGVDSKDS